MTKNCVRRAQHTGDSGFTLIEVLVSLAILALLLALVPSTLKLGRRAWETPGDIERSSETRAALSFLETRLQGAIPVFEAGPQNSKRLAFSGETEGLSFVVPLESGPFGGGLYKVATSTPGGAAPQMRISLYSTDADGAQSSTLGEDRGMAGLAAVRFRYFGPPQYGAAAQWLESWTREDRLPDLVEILPVAATKSDTWPAVRVELKLRPL